MPYIPFLSGELMPVVEIKWWKGRSVAQKKKLIKDLFLAFEQNGVKKESLHIIIHDIPKTDWANNGKQASE